MLTITPDARRDDLTPEEAHIWILRQKWYVLEKDVGGTWVVYGVRGKKRVFVYNKDRTKAWRMACDTVRLMSMIPPTMN